MRDYQKELMHTTLKDDRYANKTLKEMSVEDVWRLAMVLISKQEMLLKDVFFTIQEEYAGNLDLAFDHVFSDDLTTVFNNTINT